MIKQITLEQEDYDALHDILIEALDKDVIDDLSNEFILEVWKTIPEDLKDSAIHWGLDDSVVRDNIYEWLQQKLK